MSFHLIEVEKAERILAVYRDAAGAGVLDARLLGDPEGGSGVDETS